MTVDKVRRFLWRVPIRGRVAFTLALAAEAVDVLPKDSYEHSLAGEAVDLAWRFSEGRQTTASELNTAFNTVLDLKVNAAGDMKRALSVLATALGYVTWEAFGIDLAVGSVHAQDIPDDMARINEEWVERVYEGVESLLGNNLLTTLGDRLIRHIARRTVGCSADNVGPGLGREIVEE